MFCSLALLYEKGHIMLKKSITFFVTFTAVFGFCAVLSACQTNSIKTTSAQVYRWENFDDGSDVLSFDVPYIPSNSNSVDFNIILEQGKLSDSVSAENVTLGSALTGWQVDSATRKDDVTLFIQASRSENLSNNGASVACVSLSADAIVMSDTSTSNNSETANAQSAASDASSSEAADAEQQDKQKIYTSDEINEMKGVEWPEDAVTIDTDAQALSVETNEVVANTPEEVAQLVSDIENNKVVSEDDLQPYKEREQTENVTADTADSADAAGVSTSSDATSDTASSSDASDSAQTGSQTSDNAQQADAENSDSTATSYEVYAVFANPALTLDVEKSELQGATLSATINASDFVLSSNINKESFELTGADGCTIKDAKYVSESVLQVEVSLPSEGAISALDGAELVLKANANESEADVVCAMSVAEPWLDVQFDYADTSTSTNEDTNTNADTNTGANEGANAGTVYLKAQLNNAKGEITSNNTQLEVNGASVSPRSINKNDNNTYSIALDVQSLESTSLATVSVTGIQNLLGIDADVQPCSVLLNATEETRATEKADPESFFPSLGKKGLAALAKFGWEKFYTNVLDTENVTGVYDVSNNEVLSSVVKVQQQLIDIDTQIKALNNDVLVGQKASIINDANRLISRIKTQELQLSDGISALYKEGSKEKRLAAARAFVEKEKGTIDSLATNLGELYDVIMNADSATNHDLISAYDELVALSYNWGAQTYPYRQNFRESLARVWTTGSQIVDLAYGIQTADAESGVSSTGGSKRSYLNALQEQTANVSKLINETHAIGMKEYRYGGDWGSVDEYYDYTDADFDEWIDDLTLEEMFYFNITEEYIRDVQAKVHEYKDAGAGKGSIRYYCNTTGSWFQTLNGNDTAKKWDKGFFYSVGNGWTSKLSTHADSPFRDYEIKMTPGIKYIPNDSWDNLYANTTEVNLMIAKLHDNQTLEKELQSVGFQTAKYLVTSERFDCSTRLVYDNNDWYFDTFETAKTTKANKAFTKDKKHYDGSNRLAVVTTIQHINWHTAASDMYVLKKVKAS